MKHFFEQLAQRVAKGESGLGGNEFTFEQAWHAQDLEAALKERGIPRQVLKARQHFKVRLAGLPAAESGGQAMDQLRGKPINQRPRRRMIPRLPSQRASRQHRNRRKTFQFLF